MEIELVAAILTVASNVAKVKPPYNQELHGQGDEWKFAIQDYRKILEELKAVEKPTH